MVKHVTLLFLIQDDQILLAMKKRGFGEGRFNGVGGKIEPGERLEAAVVRECEEEIGVTPLNPLKVGRLVFRNEDTEGQDMLGHVFIASDWEGEPTETEEMAPEWFYMDMIPYDRMWAADMYWLPHILEGNGVVAEFTFDGNQQIVRHTVDVVDIERLP